jgi:hypothetical protein
VSEEIIVTRPCRQSLFIFFMQRMAAAAATELLELQPVRGVLFVLCRHVIALFAFRALQNNVISRHIFSSQHSAVSCIRKSRFWLIADADR